MPAAVLVRVLLLLVLGRGASLAADAAAPAPPCGSVLRLDAVVAALFADSPDGDDANGDDVLSAADLVAVAALGDAPACPAAAAAIELQVDNRTGARAVSVTFRGRRLRCDCAGGTGASVFEVPLVCLGTGPAPCGEVTSLAPGDWLLELRVDEPETGQVQRRRALLVADAHPLPSRWTAFAAVQVIEDTGDDGAGTLRDRVRGAASATKPLLLRFDDEVFPAGQSTVVALEAPMPPLDTDDVTIDAIDAHGVGGNRVVDAQGQAFGAFSVTGARNHLIGLGLRHAGGNDRDVVRVFGPRADGNILEGLVVEGSNSGDGIGVDGGAGKDFSATATWIRDCVVRGAGDKGIKVTTGSFARVERCWVYGNLGGGVQATLGGNVLALDSVVEFNGGAGAQNGFAVQGLDVEGGLSTIALYGNLSRGNDANGLSVRSFATALVGDSAFIGNGTAGVRVFNDVGAPALAAVTGSSMLCNAGDGLTVRDSSYVDLGGGVFGSRGENAFAFNGASGSGANLRSTVAAIIPARHSQWESCGTAAECDLRAIETFDLRATDSLPDVSSPQATRGLDAPVVTRVEPAAGRYGEWVRIYGHGFDAVTLREDGLGSELSPCPVAGATAVRIGGVAAPIEAVSPTMILARWPFTCLEPVALSAVAERVDGPVESESVRVCHHPTEP